MLLGLFTQQKPWVRMGLTLSFEMDFRFSDQKAGTQVDKSAVWTFEEWLSLASAKPGLNSLFCLSSMFYSASCNRTDLEQLRFEIKHGWEEDDVVTTL